MHWDDRGTRHGEKFIYEGDGMFFKYLGGGCQAGVCISPVDEALNTKALTTSIFCFYHFIGPMFIICVSMCCLTAHVMNESVHSLALFNAPEAPDEIATCFVAFVE